MGFGTEASPVGSPSPRPGPGGVGVVPSAKGDQTSARIRVGAYVQVESCSFSYTPRTDPINRLVAFVSSYDMGLPPANIQANSDVVTIFNQALG